MNEIELKKIKNNPKTRIYYEVSAHDLWTYIVDMEYDEIKKLLNSPKVVRSSLLLNTNGDNYNYFENCINIVEFYRPDVTDSVKILENVCYYLIDNIKINYKIVVTIDDNVKGVYYETI